MLLGRDDWIPLPGMGANRDHAAGPARRSVGHRWRCRVLPARLVALTVGRRLRSLPQLEESLHFQRPTASGAASDREPADHWGLENARTETRRDRRLKAVPPKLLNGLPQKDQRAITAMVGKAVLLVGYDEDGRAELEFDDPFDGQGAFTTTRFGLRPSSLGALSRSTVAARSHPSSMAMATPPPA